MEGAGHGGTGSEGETDHITMALAVRKDGISFHDLTNIYTKRYLYCPPKSKYSMGVALYNYIIIISPKSLVFHSLFLFPSKGRIVELLSLLPLSTIRLESTNMASHPDFTYCMYLYTYVLIFESPCTSLVTDLGAYKKHCD